MLAVSGTFRCVLVYGSSIDEVNAKFTEIKARPPSLGCRPATASVPAAALKRSRRQHRLDAG
ncbi:hypothetical protein Nm8I071_35860 [Nonomuraea sp. TT08I-71]|nr:hypothetical protein Nm8I071_35860 [Nonomuraea sp. TT08I-71]